AGPERWAGIARRLAWVLVVSNVLLIAAGVPVNILLPQTTSHYGDFIAAAGSAAGLLLQAGLGGLIAIRRPRHPVGWLLLLSSTAFAVDGGLMQNYVIYGIRETHR